MWAPCFCPSSTAHWASWKSVFRIGFVGLAKKKKFFFLAAPCMAFGILVPWPGIEPRSWQWKCWVLTTGPPGNPRVKYSHEHLLTFCPSTLKILFRSNFYHFKMNTVFLKVQKESSDSLCWLQKYCKGAEGVAGSWHPSSILQEKKAPLTPKPSNGEFRKCKRVRNRRAAVDFGV